MRCCWIGEVSLLPVVPATEPQPPACGSRACGNPACPRNRPAAQPADTIDELLDTLKAGPPDPEGLTERIMHSLREHGALDEPGGSEGEQ